MTKQRQKDVCKAITSVTAYGKRVKYARYPNPEERRRSGGSRSLGARGKEFEGPFNRRRHSGYL